MPGHFISRLIHGVTRIEQPAVKNFLIRHFMRLFRIDLTEAEISSPEEFRHFNAFFTRALKRELRPIATATNSIVSPVDGAISQLGAITDGTLFQAKGHHYSVAKLLGTSSPLCEQFAQGSFATIYLSPRDYHRIHMPFDGELQQMIHLPGRLFSVNQATAATIPALFARNERVVTLFDTALGPMAMVLVGAVNVGSIETVWAGEVTPPTTLKPRRWSYQGSAPPQLKKGEEMGRFNMGSTVILLFANGDIVWDPALSSGSVVKMGQAVATMPAQSQN
ncbi:MAG: phosphatidylserine decarboxylase [Gammaproteobacteria bacterium]|nr:phosphatidylserine decarboxylase [Gammaproteobacteria bacterium]